MIEDRDGERGEEERRGQVVAGVCERERVEMNEGTKK